MTKAEKKAARAAQAQVEVVTALTVTAEVGAAPTYSAETLAAMEKAGPSLTGEPKARAPRAERQGTSAALARSLLYQGKTNEEITAALIARDPNMPERHRKTYASWYRTDLARQLETKGDHETAKTIRAQARKVVAAEATVEVKAEA